MTRIILLSVALVIFLSAPASAHLFCWPALALKKYLEEKHKEAPIIKATDLGGWPVELWSSKNGKTWSIVTYRPRGMACLLASGVDVIELEWVEPGGERV